MKEYSAELAKKAGAILLKGFKSLPIIRIESKDPGHLVTKFDIESEKIIIGGIEKKYPTHNILSEEAGLIKKGSSYTWIVDPLDGTGNFIKKNPFFSISIALEHKKELILGIVYAPALDEFFIAEKGKGAFLNNNPISVSETQDISRSSIVSCEGSDIDIGRSAKLFREIRPIALDMRKLGSAAIESAWVACGRAEAYVVTKINPWDIAAGVILINEAGGKVTDFKGRSWNLNKSDLILTNGKIHKELIARVKEALQG
jgi:myo-inositol-1(or 4)-monophosphatase